MLKTNCLIKSKTKPFRLFILVSFFMNGLLLFSQNENKKWYFGQGAGLAFMTNPPTIITNGAMNTAEGCASIADSFGNLLFYTDGVTVWNQAHLVMSNGTGLFGNTSTSQSANVVKQPGSAPIYYIFTLDAFGGPLGLRYSIVDMSLAAGMGSVTSKNTLLFTPSAEKMTAVKHCNGVDIWVITHDDMSNNFRCYLITSAGINPVPVISAAGTIYSGGNNIGCMKASPNGKKIITAIQEMGFELYDFDRLTGVISNSVLLSNSQYYAYGCEFSIDGTKVYGSSSFFFNGVITQWNLCAGSNTAIIASQLTVGTTTIADLYAMQLATNGKIYIARINQQDLGVINSPNTLAMGCNYVDVGQSIAPNANKLGLPGFIYVTQPAPYTYSISCQTVSFTPPSVAINTVVNTCSATGYSVVGINWIFGDPLSGSTNSSSVSNPVHYYSSIGTYTAMLLLNYSCGTDTIKQTVNITTVSPTINVTGTFSICAGQTVTITAAGANLYSWSNGTNKVTVSVSPTISTSYTVVGTNTVNGCSASTIASLSVSKCTGMVPPGFIADQLVIYPNPVVGFLTVKSTKPISVVIYNVLGNIKQKIALVEGENTLDIRYLDNGIYFMRPEFENHSSAIRVIKID